MPALRAGTVVEALSCRENPATAAILIAPVEFTGLKYHTPQNQQRKSAVSLQTEFLLLPIHSDENSYPSRRTTMRGNSVKNGIRERYIERLTEDLLGPGSTSEIINERPSDRYVTGILYPG